jgi:hypothetical protein
LLIDSWRLAQVHPANQQQIAALLGAAATGLWEYMTTHDLRASANRRQAFRELGLSIGLAALYRLEEVQLERVDGVGRAGLATLARYLPLRSAIESFWMAPMHRRASTWIEHVDINEVMLATSLLPRGFLGIGLTEPRHEMPSFRPIPF